MHEADRLLRRWPVVLSCVVSVLSVYLPELCLGVTEVGNETGFETGRLIVLFDVVSRQNYLLHTPPSLKCGCLRSRVEPGRLQTLGKKWVPKG
jgi:hypothetical protein